MEASEEISRAVRRARNALRRLEPKTQRAAPRLTFASRKIRREPDAHALRSTIPNLPGNELCESRWFRRRRPKQRATMFRAAHYPGVAEFDK